jgi:hypothetical protein
VVATDWWVTGTQIAVALATLVLAGITARMAVRTREVAEETKKSTAAAIRTAKATEDDVQRGLELVKIGQDQTTAMSEQAEVARRTLEATFQPLLVPVVDRTSRDSFTLPGRNGVSVTTQLTAQPRCWLAQDTRGTQRVFVVVPVRNVGPGPASFGSSERNATFLGTYSGARPIEGRPSSPVVAANDVVDILFYGSTDEIPLGAVVTSAATFNADVATVSITYSDISRAKVTVTELRLGTAEDSLLQVTNVAIDP